MKKAIKVLSSAAIAATLVAPTVAVQPAFAASTYSVSGVQNAAAGQTIGGPVRIAVEVGAGNLIGSKSFQLRLPADSRAVLNGVKGGSAEFAKSGTQQVIQTTVTNGATDDYTPPATKAVATIGGKDVNVDLVKYDTPAKVAEKIAAAINGDIATNKLYKAVANGADIQITVLTPAANDNTLALTLDGKGTKATVGATTVLVEGEEADSGAFVPSTYDGGKDNGKDNQVKSIKVTPVNPDSTGAAQAFDITVTADDLAKSNKGLFYLELTSLYVPSGISGALNATIDSQDSTFTNGEIKIAQVGNGSVTTSIDGTIALTPGNKNDAVKTIRVKEDSAGAFAKGQKYKLELPDGFEWSDAPTAGKVVWGDTNAQLKFLTGVNDDTVEFKVVDKDGNDYETKSATQFAIDGLKVKVDDADAKKGEVKVTIKGDVSRTNDSIVIGTYGTYEGEVKAGDAKTVYAGQTGETLANVTIKEDAPGTLLEGRTLKLKLSGNAKWATKKNSSGDIVLKEQPSIKAADSEKNSLEFGTWELSGSDKTVIQTTISKPSKSKPAKIVLEKLKVDVAPTAGKGDISVAVEGTSGVRTDSVVLGKTVAPVEVSVDGEIAKIDAGLQQQAIPNIVIKEAADGLIGKDNLIVKFPEGVKPTLPGKIEVTSGNLKIDSAKVSVEDNRIIIPVSKDSSDKGATIKLSDIKVTSYRNVPEGDLKVKITGPAVVQSVTNDKKDGDVYPFNKPEDTHVAEGTVAKVVTPADKNKYAENIIFKIGSKTYTQDGKEMTMDVAPEVHPVYNRTYIPAAHFAASLNIPADKVVWNEASKTVTIFAGDKVVSATAGKKELVVNGTVVKIDAPVNYGQHTGYRVMVPYTHLALALGATVQWKADTQEIFVNQR